ncbi:class E sortase [Streptomyces sp. CB02923]|uniref:class E sortase n=1 Tax=Streptomyces sp. CB02923 TaxID=1718985 RepID=UPI00093D8D01|nr:class E sortase [Streptomyces sp. CB02923]OKH99955.1 class E sortase [Streptomyces sp. CB02923]
MTDLRREREGRSDEPSRDAGGTYGRDAFEAAVGQLDDPLTDPLPGNPPARERQPGPERNAQPGPAQPAPAKSGSPWFRPHQAPAAPPAPQRGPDPNQAPHRTANGPIPGPAQTPASAYVAEPGPTPAPTADPFLNPSLDPPYVPGPVSAADSVAGAPDPLHASGAVPAPDPLHARAPGPGPVSDPAYDAETMALRQAEERGGDRRGPDVVSRETEPASSASDPAASTSAVTGGRAARRKAAQEAAKRGNRRTRRGSSSNTADAPSSATEAPSAPMSRVEARRAERALKDSPGVIASRAMGEVFITLGVLMLLFVTYQLWWTNVLAHQQAGGTASSLEHEWDEGAEDRKPDAFSPGQGFAIMYIPKLDVKVPIAEGISKPAVLDRGMVGHYDKNSVKTAMPWDKQGNFAVAGHRNTHGEPFRYINKLAKGDKIVVETGSTYYTYEMESILPQTSPRNIGVIGPVPPGSGFKGPGRYLTLTTCTPEFTSTYRMIVWGKMVEERPRSKGKPDALVS